MEYVKKALTWAKANKSLTLFIGFIALGILSNLLGFI